MKYFHLRLTRTVLAMGFIFLSGMSWADSIRFATTTSTYNSGLLDYLVLQYEKVSDTQVQVISVGAETVSVFLFGKKFPDRQNCCVCIALLKDNQNTKDFFAGIWGIKRRFPIKDVQSIL